MNNTINSKNSIELKNDTLSKIKSLLEIAMGRKTTSENEKSFLLNEIEKIINELNKDISKAKKNVFKLF